jgi:hypothetical protein
MEEDTMGTNLKVGDRVVETGADSGVWVVREVFKNTLRAAFAAKVECEDAPGVTTYVNVDRLSRV